jgi:hypothetical protein
LRKLPLHNLKVMSHIKEFTSIGYPYK